jgi:DNA repair protein RecN (Recombination protein N)
VEISGLGVIERAHFSPGAGLTVITGETGAGKTMVLSALSLLTGSRADATVVRNGSERASIVGRFALTPEMGEKFAELGGEVDGGESLLSRTITSEGKSRAAIGGITTTISALSEIGAQLLSIHGQSANFTLLKAEKAREILDGYGGTEIAKALTTYRALYDRYREIVSTIDELLQLQSTRERELERINTFLSEFDRVNPTRNESALLRERILALENVDGTRLALSDSLQALSEGESNISSLLAGVKRSIESLGTGSGQAEANVALIREISILVTELTSSLRSQGSELDVEPGALEQMHSRRALVQSLVKRFGDASKDDPESALIEDAKRNKALFLQLSDGDQGIAQLEREREEFAANLISASEMLTKTRRSRATELEREISEELTQLAMPAARITVAIDGVGDGLAVSDEKRTLICSNTGSDSVTFLLTPHAGATPLPINKGASGGELSRIMLAIEVVLAGRSSVPTYVFDEVDAGVGGKAAVEVGRRLALLARHAQVLVVTHLPQVAVWADTHYSIRKNSSETVTTSDLALLSEGERINELARMMAGREESALAQEHAQELLDFVAAERKRMGIARGKRA